MHVKQGEVIEQVVSLGEGWASGVSADGRRTGMFPSNYCEMQEEEEEEQQQAVAPPAPRKSTFKDVKFS